MKILPDFNIEPKDNKFQNLIAQAPVLISTFIGPEFIVETINKMALNIWCKSYDEVVNKPLFVSSPELEAGLKNILDNIYQTGEPFISNEIPVELKRLGKPDKAYFNSIYQPLLDGDKNIYGIILIGTEITDAVNARKEIEKSELAKRSVLEELEKTALHFKLATDSANVGVWSLDIKTQHLEWSGLHKRLWGYDENRTDLTYADWHKIIVADDKAHAFAKVEEARVNHSFYEVEYRINKVDDQEVRYVRSVGKYSYNHLGEAETLTGISMDITEQKTVEEALKKTASHFKLATESANVGVWSLDIKTQQLEWSGVHKKMWGYDENRLDLTYTDWHSIILSKDKKLAFKKVEDSRVNHTFYDVEYRIKRPSDNVIRWIRSVGQYYYNEADEAITLTGISLDITDQKAFTEELENKVLERTKELALRTTELENLNKTLDVSNIALESANAELKSFSYVASHDLQEPLNQIKVFSEIILEEEKFSDETKEYFNFIIKATERMKNLIISLIDYSRLERTEFELVDCDLNTIVEESKRDLQLRIIERNAIIECGHLPVINGLYIPLSQLFTNLISNSIKYCHADTIPRIKITSERMLGKEIDSTAANKKLEYYAIKIADNGIGFEEKNATKIFDAFKRLHGKGEYVGTGIGLSIVKKIVTNHNGFIVAEGQINVGAIFTIYLPVT